MVKSLESNKRNKCDPLQPYTYLFFFSQNHILDQFPLSIHFLILGQEFCLKINQVGYLISTETRNAGLQ